MTYRGIIDVAILFLIVGYAIISASSCITDFLKISACVIVAMFGTWVCLIRALSAKHLNRGVISINEIFTALSNNAIDFAKTRGCTGCGHTLTRLYGVTENKLYALMQTTSYGRAVHRWLEARPAWFFLLKSFCVAVVYMVIARTLVGSFVGTPWFGAINKLVASLTGSLIIVSLYAVICALIDIAMHRDN
jgi:hypothetical protein